MTSSTSGWIRRHPIGSALIIVVVPSMAALLAAPFVNSDLGKALYTGAAGLFFAGLIGGFVKILLDSYTLGSQQRASDTQFVLNVLADLKAVYDRVERVRVLIPAHRSAKTYGDEMRDLIDARVVLRNVIRALDTRTDTVSNEPRRVIRARVKQMEEYLAQLTEEFRREYKGLADHQRVYEAQVEARLKSTGENAQVESVFVGENMWAELSRLPRLLDFVGTGPESSYDDRFERSLDEASGILRAEVARISRGEPADTSTWMETTAGQQVVATSQGAAHHS